MNTKLFSWRRSNLSDGTLRQTMFSSLRAGVFYGKGIRAWGLVGVIVCLVVLILGFVEYYSAVVPLETKVLSREVRGLAEEIDSMVKLKTAVITTAAGVVEVDTLVENGRLEAYLRTLRERLPDFLSMEIINDRGEVVAMIGELPLSQAISAGPVRASKFVRVGSDINYNEGIFVDEPANGFFSITCRHIAPQQGQWFSKSRFSRDSIERALSSVPDRRAALIPVAGISKTTRQSKELDFITTSGTWWSGPNRAEALLASPGWIVRLETASTGSFMRSPCVLFPSMLLLFAGISYLAHMFFAAKTDAAPQADVAPPQPPSRDDAPDGALASPPLPKETGKDAGSEVCEAIGLAVTEVHPSPDATTGSDKGARVETAEPSDPSAHDEELLGAPLPVIAFESDSSDDLFSGRSQSPPEPAAPEQNSTPPAETAKEKKLETLAAECSPEVERAIETCALMGLVREERESPLPANTAEAIDATVGATSDTSGRPEPFPAGAGATPQSRAAGAEGDPGSISKNANPADAYVDSLIAASEATVTDSADVSESANNTDAFVTTDVCFDLDLNPMDSVALSGASPDIPADESFPCDLDLTQDFFVPDEPESESCQTAPYYPAVILGPPPAVEKSSAQKRAEILQPLQADAPETLEFSWAESPEELHTTPVAGSCAPRSQANRAGSQEPDLPESLEVTWFEQDPKTESCDKSREALVRRNQYTSC
jgi:hypothetical protein